ncbi:Protein SKT5, partial [Neolecta irregularis DAH-3]
MLATAASSPVSIRSGETLENNSLYYSTGTDSSRSLTNLYVPQGFPNPQAPPQHRAPLFSEISSEPSHLRPGNKVLLQDHSTTLNLYRLNAKKSSDPTVQFDFANFIIETVPSDESLLKEAIAILRKLADKGYPDAQYFLADCYSQGTGVKGGERDMDKAFPLFHMAAKHGHTEAAWRTAECYEHGLGTKPDAAKAVQFLRKAASSSHPGAMLRLAKANLEPSLGLPLSPREGIKWLKRAVEHSTTKFNCAPFELAQLHESGYKDVIFQDFPYVVQLLCMGSDLGHAECSTKLGEAYEYGNIGCPVDAGLSIHYYTLAAMAGHAGAMYSLCAWYMCGAPAILAKNEAEAYEWAKKAAEAGLAKAEYAVGFFLESGIGCVRDALEANLWYVRAAEHGEERARNRLADNNSAAAAEAAAAAAS